ncbi:MAG: hypothetical protein ACOCX3_01170 [Chloroflexota bacterium]
MHILLLVNLSITLIMVGIITFVQFVHYPLFNRVGTHSFQRYEADHTLLITRIVMPLMLTEFLTALLIAIDPPAEVNQGTLWFGVLLIGIIWGSTLLIQMPLHSRLAAGFDDQAYRMLVISNWIRTAAWVMRGLLMLGAAAGLIDVTS